MHGITANKSSIFLTNHTLLQVRYHLCANSNCYIAMCVAIWNRVIIQRCTQRRSGSKRGAPHELN